MVRHTLGACQVCSNFNIIVVIVVVEILLASQQCRTSESMPTDILLMMAGMIKIYCFKGERNRLAVLNSKFQHL